MQVTSVPTSYLRFDIRESNIGIKMRILQQRWDTTTWVKPNWIVTHEWKDVETNE